MPLAYVNAQEKTYDLHPDMTRTGKPTYHFDMKSNGHLANHIPKGYEIRENPNAQVDVRFRQKLLPMTSDSL
jgi:hypothetical protein